MEKSQLSMEYLILLLGIILITVTIGLTLKIGLNEQPQPSFRMQGSKKFSFSIIKTERPVCDLEFDSNCGCCCSHPAHLTIKVVNLKHDKVVCSGDINITITSPGNYEYDFNNPGSYYVRCECLKTDKNYITYVNIDYSPPSPGDFVYPVNTNVDSNVIRFTWTYASEYRQPCEMCGVNYELRIYSGSCNGTLLYDINRGFTQVNKNIYVDVDFSSQSPGTYYWTVTACDYAGNCVNYGCTRFYYGPNQSGIPSPSRCNCERPIIHIKSCNELRKIGWDNNYPTYGYYILDNNIVCDNILPIGCVKLEDYVYACRPFVGVLDGNNKTLKIKRLRAIPEESNGSTVLLPKTPIGNIGLDVYSIVQTCLRYYENRIKNFSCDNLPNGFSDINDFTYYTIRNVYENYSGLFYIAGASPIKFDKVTCVYGAEFKDLNIFITD